MKPISKTLHGGVDYAMAVLLISGPYLFGFRGDDMESKVLYVAGGTLLLYSMLTKYQFGVVKLIPMKVHLLLDVMSGLLLASSPWIFGFADRVFLPHLILGIIEITAGLTTNTEEPTNRLIE